MNTSGWIFMIGSWAVILWMLIFSLLLILRPEKENKGSRDQEPKG